MITPLSKVIDLKFNLNETNKSLLFRTATGKQFNTTDTDAWLQIEFTDTNIQSGAYNLTLINLKDHSKFEHEGIAFNSNPFYYKLDSGADMLKNEIKHAGTWIGQLVVTLDNGQSTTQQFIFDIESHILDGEVASVTMLEGYSVLMTQIQNSKDLLDKYNIDYAALLADLEATYNSRLFSVEQQLEHIAINATSYGAIGDGLTDDTVAIQATINALTEGGTVKFDRGKTYVVDSLKLVSNVTIDLNGSTIKQKSNVPIYHNIFDIGGSGLVKNVTIKNGKLNGNKANNTAEFYRYGIYTLNCDTVYIEDMEIFDFTGDGIFVGYTGYYSKNVFINRVHLHGSLSNDLAITNAENVFVTDLIVDSIAYDSGSVDLELQDVTDKIINVNFRNLTINSSVQQMKIVKNGFAGVLKNITIDNAVFTGAKSLGIEDADIVTLSNIQAEQGIEIIGCRDVVVNGMKIQGSTNNGLYVYKNAINGNISNNITLNNLDVSGSNGYGVLLQDVNVAMLSNVQSYNNTGNGVGVLYNNKNINMINVVSTDRRTTGKTQPYGIEFQGVNSNIQIIGGSMDGNLLSNYLNLPTVINIINKTTQRFISPNGEGSHAFEYGDDSTLTWGAFLKARRFSLNAKYNPSVDTIPNGSIFEDTNMATLKYKNQDGTVHQVSSRPVSAMPTTGSWLTGDRVFANNPTAGGYIGWVCILGGSPGTWKGFGLIQA